MNVTKGTQKEYNAMAFHLWGPAWTKVSACDQQ